VLISFDGNKLGEIVGDALEHSRTAMIEPSLRKRLEEIRHGSENLQTPRLE